MGLNKVKNNNIKSRKLRSKLDCNLKKMKQKSHFNENLTIASINIQGMSCDSDKRRNLCSWMKAKNIDFLCVQEWYIHHNDKKFELNEFDGYEAAYCDNNTKTVILYKDTIKINEFKEMKIEYDGFDINWIGMECNDSILFIASLYQRPSKECNFDLDIISKHKKTLINKFKSKKNHFFVINGDFNARCTTWGSSKNEERGEMWFEWNAANGMVTINNGNATHINKSNGKEDVLDLSIVSENLVEFVSNWHIDKYLYEECGISDHYAYCFNLRIKKEEIESYSKYAWQFNDSKNEEFILDLDERLKQWDLKWNKYSKYKCNLTELVKAFSAIIYKSCKSVFGLKEINYKKQTINKLSQMDHLFTQRRSIVNAISKKKKLIKQMIKNGIKNSIKMNRLCKEIERLKKNRNKMNRKIKHKERNLAKKHGESIEELINEAAFKDDKLLYKIYNKLSSSRPVKIKQLRDKITH